MSTSSTPFPDEYHVLHSERELVAQIKATISAASKAVGRIVAADKIPGSHEELSSSLAQLDVLLIEYKQKRTTTESDVVVEVVTEASEVCATLPSSKDAYAEFAMSIQRLTRMLFTEQTRLLRLLKDAKTRTAS